MTTVAASDFAAEVRAETKGQPPIAFGIVVGRLLGTHANRHQRDAAWRALSLYTIAKARTTERSPCCYSPLPLGDGSGVRACGQR